MNSVDGVIVERRGSTVLLTMSNPGKRNAFFPELRRRLATTLYETGMEPDVRAFVLTGEGGHFCAGADLTRAKAPAPPPTPLSIREAMKEVHHLLRAITAGTRPVIAAVEGDAFGAGMSMVAACDKVFAGRTARFGTAFAKIGILPDMGILHTLPARVGLSKARDLMYFADPIGAEEGARIGLVDELTEPGKSLDAALAYAAKFDRVPPLATAYTKAALATGIRNMEDAMRAEIDYQPILALSEDSREGRAAFVEKRPPRFRGR